MPEDTKTPNSLKRKQSLIKRLLHPAIIGGAVGGAAVTTYIESTPNKGNRLPSQPTTRWVAKEEIKTQLPPASGPSEPNR